MYLFTSESVSEGHPDKVADQISDALLDQFLAYDEKSHCAIESFVTTGQVVLMGEVTSEAYIDLQNIARKTIKKSAIQNQSTSLTATLADCSLPYMSRAATSTGVYLVRRRKTKEPATRA